MNLHPELRYRSKNIHPYLGVHNIAVSLKLCDFQQMALSALSTSASHGMVAVQGEGVNETPSRG